jgi:hypothetical protein
LSLHFCFFVGLFLIRLLNKNKQLEEEILLTKDVLISMKKVKNELLQATSLKEELSYLSPEFLSFCLNVLIISFFIGASFYIASVYLNNDSDASFPSPPAGSTANTGSEIPTVSEIPAVSEIPVVSEIPAVNEIPDVSTLAQGLSSSESMVSIASTEAVLGPGESLYLAHTWSGVSLIDVFFNRSLFRDREAFTPIGDSNIDNTGNLSTYLDSATDIDIFGLTAQDVIDYFWCFF